MFDVQRWEELKQRLPKSEIEKKLNFQIKATKDFIKSSEKDIEFLQRMGKDNQAINLLNKQNECYQFLDFCEYELYKIKNEREV